MVDIQRLTEIRVRRPGAIAEAYATRTRRPLVGDDGRLMVIAADHPARGALAAGARPSAMADRADLLERLSVALSRPGVDGLLAAPDVVEDLLLSGALEGKVVIGSMNRGGLPGSVFEIDDRYTAYTAERIAADRLDGGKLLLRIDPEDPASAVALERAATAVGDLAARSLVTLVEPFLARRVGGRLVNDLSEDAVVRSAAVASALGPTSAYTWLKLPLCEADPDAVGGTGAGASDGDAMARVAGVTTLPIVVLGGEVDPDPDRTYARWEKALAVPNVRGLMVGRTLLYPPDDDVSGAVDIAVGLLRGLS